MTRAFYRGYRRDDGSRAGQVTRLHVLREDNPDLSARGWCGTSASRHSDSSAQIIDPMPATPPEGLSWCPPCIGHLAAQRGLIAEIAFDLAGADLTGPTVAAPPEGECEHCHQKRPLFRYEPQHNVHLGPQAFTCRWCTRAEQPLLCVRCHDAEAEMEANDPDLTEQADVLEQICATNRRLLEAGAQ